MNNVHEDEPVVFHTRWALSYLRGPLSRRQIKSLMDPHKIQPDRAARPAPPPEGEGTKATVDERPLLPAEVQQRFLRSQHVPATAGRLVYRPALCATSKMHFVRASYRVDVWDTRTSVALITDDSARAPWEHAVILNSLDDLVDQPEANFECAAGPSELTREKSYPKWKQQLKTHLYQGQTMGVWKCTKLKLYSEAGETEGDFRARLARRCKEQRDLQVEKLRKRYGAKLATLRERIRSAEARVARETEQFRKASFNSAVSIGSSLIGALFGRKLMSRTNVGRASSSMRSLSSAAGQRGDIARAQDKLESYEARLQELEQAFESDADQLELECQANSLELEALELRPRKSDIQVKPISIVWTPWQVDGNGIAEPLFAWESR